MLQSRWEAIAESIRSDIQSGALKPGDRLPTETELLERWGVARMTVHRAMKRLHEEGLIVRRRGIGSVVASLAPRDNRSVALVLRHHDNVFESGFAEGIREGLPDARHLIVYSSKDAEHERQLVKDLSRETDGIIIFPTCDPANTDSIRATADSGFPLVFIDRIPDGLEVDAVVTDNYNATLEALRSMIARGHRRIAFFGAENPHISSARERYEAYVRAMEEAGTPDCERFVRTFPPGPQWRFLLQSTQDAVAAMIHDEEPITAAFAVHDQFLAAILESCDRLDIDVPGQLELVSFCDYPEWILRESHGVCRIVQQTRLVGRLAAERLLHRIKSVPLPPTVIRVPALFHPSENGAAPVHAASANTITR